MPELLGYARVSTTEQDAGLQVDALKAAGCEKIWIDKLSGSTTKRPELQKLLEFCRDKDSVVVWRLDRLGRSTSHLLRTIEELSARGVGFRSLTEAIDSSTASGQLLLTVLSAIAQFELSLVKERTLAGIESARKSGVRLGRPPKLTHPKVKAARDMRESGNSSIREIAEALGVSKRTVYRALELGAEVVS